jgi:hypothetical protein
MVAIKSSENHTWPWSDAPAEDAEAAFQRSYPAVHRHLLAFRDRAIARQDQGRFWWELRSCSYWEEFEREKVLYQEIQYHPWYALSGPDVLANNKVFLLPTSDQWLMAVLNSPLMWWYNWRYLPHMKDEALTPMGFKMESVPIARGDEEQVLLASRGVRRLVEITRQRQQAQGALLDWLRAEFDIEKPSQRLAAPADLDADAFVAEVRKARGRKRRPMSAAQVQALHREHAETIEPVRVEAAEAARLERALADLVHAAYGLTDADLDLMWRTAPPRMPLAAPSIHPTVRPEDGGF